jgi:signal transduction histidine kinase/ligand-binding sensor domain-containing protein
VDFVVYNSENTPELPSAGIVNLHVDQSGRLFVSTYQGMVLREDGRWRRLAPEEEFGSRLARTFCERGNGDVLITTFDGGIFEFSGGKMRPLPPPPGEAGKGYSGAADEAGNWWVVQNRFIGLWNTNRVWERKLEPENLPREAFSVARARQGGMWILMGTRVCRWFGGAVVSQRTLPGTPGAVWSMSEDSSGNLWIVTYDNGFFRLSPDGAMAHWGDAEGWSAKGRVVFEDREGNLWAGTSGDGLLRLTQRRFSHLDFAEQGKPVIHSLSADTNGSVWAASYGKGLFRLDENGRLSSYPIALTNGTPYLQSVLVDHAGRLWVGSFNRHAWMLEGEQARKVVLPPAVGSNVLSLFEDSRGGVWMSGGNEAVARHGVDGVQAFGAAEGLKKGAFACFAQGADGAVWGANRQGVFRQEPSGVFVEIKDQTGEPIRGVLCLKADADGCLWMGTRNRGLMGWKDGRLQAVDEANGLRAGPVYGLIEDKEGWLWVISERVMLRVRLEDLHKVAHGASKWLHAHMYDITDGLPKADLVSGHQPNCALDSQGRLWFATTRGIVTVNPRGLSRSEVKPPVYVEKVAFHPAGRASAPQVQEFEPGHPGMELVLPPGSGGIEIHYAALSFAAPEKVRYQARLKGVHQDWQEVGPRRVAYYEPLSPGHFVFQVRAVNNAGTWNLEGASLRIVQQAYYWQTAWFRGGLGLLLIALGAAGAWLWLQRKVNRALERERLALELQQLREALAHSGRVSAMGQMASALAHELNQPLGAILRNAEAAELIMNQTSPDLPELRAILADIRQDDQRAAQVIERMRAFLKHKKIEPHALSMRELVEDVVKLVRQDLLRRGVELSIEAAAELPLVQGDRVQLQQVLLNLFLNAMDAVAGQPTERRRVHVKVRLVEKKRVEVGVRDFGAGIPANHLRRLFEPFFTTKPDGMGLGLPISRSIVEVHGGQLWAEDLPGGGALFCFTIPTA